MQMLLFHGRKDPDENLDDWGFDAPIIENVAALYVTYQDNFRVQFQTQEDAEIAHKLTGWDFWDHYTLLMTIHDDMIQTKDGYFGDWSLT